MVKTVVGSDVKPTQGIKQMRKILMLFFMGLSLVAAAQIPATVPELDNGTLHIKLDLSRGGAISYISVSGTGRNIVNIGDEGRYIQQSFYAGNAINRQSEGQSPAWSPWPWNPIQVGDAYHNRAQILDFRKTADTLYVKCIPMLWDMNNKPAEAFMEQWTVLNENVLHVTAKLTCQRTDTIYGEGVYDDQELPAVYPISALSNLYSYFGNRPFSGDAVDHPCLVNLSSGFWGRYENNMVTENWMAVTDDNLWGMGVYNPGCTDFLAGLSGTIHHEANSSSTCYIAPVKKEALLKNSVYSFDYYLLVGTLNQIRTEIYQVHANQLLEMPEANGLLTDIWPNPANKTLNIRATCLCNNEAYINVFNMRGQKVYSANTALQSVLQIDVSALPKGVYLVNISDGENVVRKKLVVE